MSAACFLPSAGQLCEILIVPRHFTVDTCAISHTKMRIQKRRLNSAFPHSCMLEKVLANRRTWNPDTRALAIECLREVRGEANIHVLIYLENKR